jgi:hypothetical protein
MSRSKAATELHRALVSISSRWPADPNRPQHQLGSAIAQSADRAFGVEHLGGRKLTEVEEKAGSEMVDALQRLLDDRARKAVSYSPYGLRYLTSRGLVTEK